ncbi:MAG: hypothetical protein VCC01_03385, partial [Candidatus Hydrogenedentota bacterium]
THENSGLGQIACASCHIDGRMDRLSWDLGNPAAITDESNAFPDPADSFFADIKGAGDGLIFSPASGTNPNDAINTLVFPGNPGNEESDYPKFHPMKGPMTTQTLQDIIGKEPHHWRGDKDGIEEFAGAFDGLQGDDNPLSVSKMQEFEDFLATISFPPNPLRPLDNTLPGGPTADGGTNENLNMTGFFTAPPPSNTNLSDTGTPMETAVPNGGDAWNGYTMYVDDTADSNFRCVDCHTLPIGAGPTEFMNGASLPFTDFRSISPGANGEAHQMVVNLDGTGQKHIKIPQTRNQLDKEGFFLNQLTNGSGTPMISRAGFGVLHDGSIDGIVRFLSEPAFSNINDRGPATPSYAVGNSTSDDESVADIVSFTLAIAGADFDYLATLSGAPSGSIPPAAVDQSAHVGVGHSITIDATPSGSSDEENTIYAMSRRADEDVLGMVVVGKLSSERRGWAHSSGTNSSAIFQSDRSGETIGMTALLALAGTTGAEMTFLMVPTEETARRGYDRDLDTLFDGDETDNGTDPTDSDSDNDGLTDGEEVNTHGTNPNNADSDGDGIGDLEEIVAGTDPNMASDNIWVDFAWTGSESGTVSEPYKTLSSATGAVVSGGIVWIIVPASTTSTTWIGTLNTAFTLNVSGGTATIGAP